MSRISRIIKNPRKYLSPKHILYSVIGSRLFIIWMKNSKLIKNDKLYLKIFYRLRMQKKLNFKNPINYTEKIQCLKLQNTDPLYSKMVDKYQARAIVKEKIGEEFLIPLIGVWDRFEDIKFDELPNEFVLKTTHDSGNVAICNDKATFNFESTGIQLTEALKTNYFYISRETPYKNAIPRIICEKLMKIDGEEDLIDYKFFCFNGEVKFLQVVTTQDGKKHNSYFDIDFNQADFKISGFPAPDKLPKKPDNFEKMLSIAKTLSANLPHIRIDLYDINNRIFFGEFTFHHNGGILLFEPVEWDKYWGEQIILN